jgi:acyl carrier protein
MGQPEELREALRAIVAEIAEIDEVPDDTSFKELGIDSMMAIEIVAEIERRYKLKVPEEELQKIRDLNSVVALVSDRVASKLSQ